MGGDGGRKEKVLSLKAAEKIRWGKPVGEREGGRLMYLLGKRKWSSSGGKRYNVVR